MTRVSILAAISLAPVAALVAAADAQPAAGWVQIGERELAATTAVQELPIGVATGAYDKLEIVVDRAHADDLAIAAELGTDQPEARWQASAYRMEGTKRVLDLPGPRTIRWLEFVRYSTGKPIRVTVFGHRAATAPAAAVAPAQMISLGSRKLESGLHVVKIDLAKPATYGSLALGIDVMDVQLVDVSARFARTGPGLARWHLRAPATAFHDSPTFWLDIPDPPAPLRSIEIRYRRANATPNKLVVWGQPGTSKAVAAVDKSAATATPPTSPPPPGLAETPGTAPADQIWARGHHEWTGDAYRWVPGHWERTRAGKRWTHAHWLLRTGQWELVPGAWN